MTANWTATCISSSSTSTRPGALLLPIMWWLMASVLGEPTLASSFTSPSLMRARAFSGKEAAAVTGVSVAAAFRSVDVGCCSRRCRLWLSLDPSNDRAEWLLRSSLACTLSMRLIWALDSVGPEGPTWRDGRLILTGWWN